MPQPRFSSSISARGSQCLGGVVQARGKLPHHFGTQYAADLRRLTLPAIVESVARRERIVSEIDRQILEGVGGDVDRRARLAVGPEALHARVHLIEHQDLAARLMGATLIVTGLSPEIAQTLVIIGVDLGKMETVGDLQGGIEKAERMLGYKVVLVDEDRGL